MGSPLMYNRCDNLVWIDCETTGLNFQKDHILEIAVVITDGNLNELESYSVVIRHTAKSLKHMSKWSKEQFSIKSPITGLSLIDRCMKEEDSVFLHVAERHIVAMMDRHNNGTKMLIAGSSIQYDKRFLEKRMPSLHDRLHYRVLDVSGLLEVIRRWNPAIEKYQPPKKGNHTALLDVHSSLDLMRFYVKIIKGIKVE